MWLWWGEWFHPPPVVWPWLIEVSSTPCGVGVVLVMVVVMVIRLQGHVEAWSESCGTGFTVFVGGLKPATPPPVVLWPVVWTLWVT